MAALRPKHLAMAFASSLVLGCRADEPYAPAPNAIETSPGAMNAGASPLTVAWSIQKALPSELRAPAATAGAGRLYIFGGNAAAFSSTNATRIYTAATNTWSFGASFTKPRDFAMAGFMADGVHLVGGAGAGGLLSDHRVYRVSSNTWLARAPLPTPVDAAVARVVLGRLYIIGGGSASGPSGKVQVFNPSTNSWSLKRAMPTARLSAASAVIGGLIYVAGGQTAGIGTTAKLERYNPTSNTWTTLAAMPVAREALSGGNVGGQFCVAGGRLAAPNPTGDALGQTFCYDPSTNTWTGGPDMITPRAEAAATEFQGFLYTLGGRTAAAFATRNVERLGVPSLELISARDHIPGAFVSHRAAYADAARIYLGSFQGTLFVLNRDRATNFPIVQTIDVGAPITGLRGDALHLYVTGPNGLRVYTKGSSLQQAGPLALPGYLGTVELIGGKIYVTRGQAELAVDQERLFLAQLNEGDVAWEVDKTTLQVTRTYGEVFAEHKTVVYDRLTGAALDTIANPDDVRGSVAFPRLFSTGLNLLQTVAGPSGRGITIVKGPTFDSSELIPATFTNVARSVPNGIVSGMETGSVDYFDAQNHLIKQADLRLLTGHTGGDDIEIRSLWTDSHDDLVFAASSWGNDASRGPTLPSFFVLRLR
jgi:N-acetylneuraminic acid mutarotase